MTKRLTKEEKERRKRQRKAAKAIKSLLTRLRKGCDQFESVDSWISFARGRVKTVADEFEDVLPDDTFRAMRRADQLVEATLSAVQTACRVLTSKLEEVLLALTASAVGAGLLSSSLAATLAGGAVIVVGVAAAVVVFITLTNRIELTLISQGCPVIEFPQDIGIVDLIPGFEVPETLETDDEAVMTFPVLGTTLQAEPGQLVIEVAGFETTLDLDLSVNEITLDDETLIGSGAVELTRGEHELVLVCQ